MITLLYILLLIISFVLSGIILIQDSKAGGLSGAFGGVGGEAVLGAGAAGGISKFTGWVSVAFFVVCILIGVLQHGSDDTSGAVDDPTRPGGAALTSEGEPPVNPNINVGGNTNPSGATPGNGTTGNGTGNGAAGTPAAGNTGNTGGTTPNTDNTPNPDSSGG